VILLSRLSAATFSDGLQKGKDYYFAGEFKKAIVQFQGAIQAHPNDPEPHLWLGKSYAVLADLHAPILGARAHTQARQHLTKAVQLAPDSIEYRRELFYFLIGSDDAWSALQEAEALLGRMPAAERQDPELRFWLQEKRRERASPEARTGKLLVWAPRKLGPLGRAALTTAKATGV
jgi:tetratricopeptide (TPR) repeat protein